MQNMRRKVSSPRDQSEEEISFDATLTARCGQVVHPFRAHGTCAGGPPSPASALSSRVLSGIASFGEEHSFFSFFPRIAGP